MAHPNRWSLHSAEDKKFKKALEMMWPGIGGKLWSEKKLAGSQLDKEHDLWNSDENEVDDLDLVVMLEVGGDSSQSSQ